MEKKLNKMKASLESSKARIQGFMACVLILLCVFETDVLPLPSLNEQVAAFVKGFQIGLLNVLLITCLLKIIKYRKALKDEQTLKRLYNKENDEMKKYVNQQVGKASMFITTAVLVVAAIIAGYFNITVFITILAVTLLQALIQLALTFYYTHNLSAKSEEE